MNEKPSWQKLVEVADEAARQEGYREAMDKVKGLIDKRLRECRSFINNASDPYESLPYDHIDSYIAEAVISTLETLKVEMENSHE